MTYSSIWYYFIFLHSSISLRYLITIKNRNCLLMSSFHFVCKNMIGWCKIRLKVLILWAPLKTREKERKLMSPRMKLQIFQHKRDKNKMITISFSKCLDMWRRNILNITFNIQTKVNFMLLVCSKVNLASVPRNIWWLDSGATTNINVSMQGYLNYHKSNEVERYIYVIDGNSVEVEVIGNFRSLLCTGF